VKRRLRALICVVHAFPDQEGICSYFVAQPELTGELVDLLRPTVSSGSATSGFVGRRGNRDDDPRGGGGGVGGSILAALSDSPLVPYDVRTLAVEALTALVARRDVAQATSGSRAADERAVGIGRGEGTLPGVATHPNTILAGGLEFVLPPAARSGAQTRRRRRRWCREEWE